jgi:DNA-binding transcriptional LysR family regulator
MDTKRLDLNLLVTLETLLVERNVTKAAARLHLSQPAVSTQLNRLRHEFDDLLLIPAQRGMTPTAKAMELLDPLRQALDQVRATVASHRNFDPAKAKLTFAIACTDYLQAAVVKPLVVELRRLAPGVRVALRNLDVPQLEAQMARGDVDLALMTPQAAPPSLRTRHLFDERYVLIGRRKHPRLRDGITVAEFAKLEQVIVSLDGGGFVTPVDSALAALGHRRNAVRGFILVRSRDRVSVGLRGPGPGTASARPCQQAQGDGLSVPRRRVRSGDDMARAGSRTQRPTLDPGGYRLTGQRLDQRAQGSGAACPSRVVVRSRSHG